MIVTDAGTLVVATIDGGETGARARARLRHERLRAPDLVFIEVASVLRRLVRATTISTQQARTALLDLRSLPLVAVPHRPLLDRIWELRDNLTAYDATYVATAEALDATLLTTDGRLAAAPGPTCPIEVLAPR